MYILKEKNLQKGLVLVIAIVTFICLGLSPTPFDLQARATIEDATNKTWDPAEEDVSFMDYSSTRDSLTLTRENGETVTLPAKATGEEADNIISYLHSEDGSQEPVYILVSFTGDEIEEHRVALEKAEEEEARKAAEIERLQKSAAAERELQISANAEGKTLEDAKKEAKIDFFVNEYKNAVPKSVPAVDTTFKSYMGYTTITLKSSTQYKIEQDERTYTDKYGFRRFGQYYLVALGSYYAKSAGETFRIVLNDGTEFLAMTGDIKADRHTDANNQLRWSRGTANLVEFVVDTSVIDRVCKQMGDMGYANSGMMHAGVAAIYKLPATYRSMPEAAFY